MVEFWFGLEHAKAFLQESAEKGKSEPWYVERMPEIPQDAETVQVCFTTYIGGADAVLRLGMPIGIARPSCWHNPEEIPARAFAYAPYVLVFQIPITWVDPETLQFDLDLLPIPIPNYLAMKHTQNSKWLHPCLIVEILKRESGEFVTIYKRDDS